MRTMTQADVDELAEILSLAGGRLAGDAPMLASLEVENDSIQIDEYTIQSIMEAKTRRTIAGSYTIMEQAYELSGLASYFDSDTGEQGDVVVIGTYTSAAAALAAIYVLEEDSRLANIIEGVGLRRALAGDKG